MSSSNSELHHNRVFDEFSPKKAILQTRYLALYIGSKWLTIIVVSLLFGAAGYLYTHLKKPQYFAEITFALDEGASSQSKSPAALIQEKLGIEVESEAGGVFSSMSNIVELIKSRLLIEKTLKSSVTIKGKKLVFADFFLDSLDYRDKWIKDRPNHQLNFKSYSANSTEGLLTNSVINNMYDVLVNKYLSITTKGDGTTIISVTCISENELFSKYFLEALLNEVTEYYIETKTQRSKINLAFLQRKTDSVKTAYYNTMYNRASFADSHSNPSRQIATVYRDKQLTDVQILRTSYSDLVKSLDAAKNSLLKDTPLFQFLDTPILPLKKFNSNPLLSFLMFAIVGACLTIGYFFTKRMLQYFMRS